MSAVKPGRWRHEVAKIVGDMLDHPDELGIYPTTECYEKLDALIEKIKREQHK